jgi:hypothetical protein
MPCLKPFSAAALVLGLSAVPATADVTGAQVWADWKEYLQGFGYEITGAETQSGDTLTVTDIVMSMSLPEDEGDVQMTMGTLSFTDNADGTVSVNLPAQMPLRFNVTPEDQDEAARGTMLIEQVGQVMLVSSDPGDFTYTYSADAMTMTLEDFEAADDEGATGTFDFVVGLTDISSTTRTTVDDMRSYEGSLAAAALTYEMSFDVPEGPEQGSGSFKGAMNGLSVTGTGQFPEGMDPAMMNEMIAAGTEVTSTMTYQSGSSDINVDSSDGPFSATTRSTGGTFVVNMGADGLLYDLSQTGVEMTAQTMEFPLPITLNMAESGFRLAMPLAQSQEPQGFAFGFKLGDFTISDTIWGLFDPTGQLPRDPATLELDLAGTARVLADIFDPMAMTGSTAPGEINSLDIRTVLVDMIGARLSGSGAFTFDNSDMVSFDGMPRPEGSLDLRLEGANALLDKLVGMGLLPQEQAMGARMMMGLFGVPQGDDTLTSKIEVNAEGHVLANGQRLQ